MDPARFVEVAFPNLALEMVFDYAVSEELASIVTSRQRVIVPFRNTTKTGLVCATKSTSSQPGTKDIIDVLDPQHLPAPPGLLKLAQWISSYYCCSLPVALRTMLPSFLWHHGRKGRELLWLERQFNAYPAEEKLTARQQHLVTALLTYPHEVQASTFINRERTTVQALGKLEQKGLIAFHKKRMTKDPFEGHDIIPSIPHLLSDQQKEALKKIETLLAKEAFGTLLLHGITGSGKTEVYMQAVEHLRKQEKGALMLAPEIALTPQLVKRFRARFHDTVGILHSKLSVTEKESQFTKIMAGQIKIVIGPRSALFAPLRNLGIIIVDEEHDRSYKQDEYPFYHARDVAVMRAKIEGIPIVLGSATPSLESSYNAQQGKYEKAQLTERVSDAQLPSIRVEDMSKEIAKRGHFVFLSTYLKDRIIDRILKQQQVILFLNRRGFSTMVYCNKCGYVFVCDHCNIILTLHKHDQDLRCHYCQKSIPMTRNCTQCKGPHLKQQGMGTQKIETVIEKLFPQARIARMDADTTATKKGHEHILNDFAQHKTDILIGTQMITKGMDIPNVTLVGVISADTSLSLPDFRATEHTFQMLTQVAGRAGRGDKPGEVVFQTFNPNHFCIRCAANQDYGTFYTAEIVNRREFRYPPFSRIINILCKSKDERLTAQYALALYRTLKQALENKQHLAHVRRATPAAISKIKNTYRWQMLLMTRSVSRVTPIISSCITSLTAPGHISFSVDVDCQSLL